MMGVKVRDCALLVAVSLNDLVPADHFYRRLERAFDLAFVRELVRDRYKADGRPSIDPVVVFEGLRSERQLMAVVGDRLSLRWHLDASMVSATCWSLSVTTSRSRCASPIRKAWRYGDLTMRSLRLH